MEKNDVTELESMSSGVITSFFSDKSGIDYLGGKTANFTTEWTEIDQKSVEFLTKLSKKLINI